MRIISKFHDFYDSVQRQGQDDTCVWIRRMETETKNNWEFPKAYSNHGYDRGSIIEAFVWIIGFCGKIYPVVEMVKKKSFYDPENERAICHNIEDVTNFVKENFKENEFDVYLQKKPAHYRYRYGIRVTQEGIKKFFDECEQKQDDYKNIFVENSTPVFIAEYSSVPSWHERKITYHGRNKKGLDDNRPMMNAKKKVTLNKFDFYRIMDPYTAFQEIHMYLSGVLGTGNPVIPEVSNNDLIESKGFDLKSSFRKESSKK